jgi:tetratricopeptide (TPR) repeat protein
MIRRDVRLALGAIAIGCLFVPVNGAALGDPYTDCMALARSNPEQGFDEAVTWEALGGGDAARHCVAVALNGLGEHAEAARRLEFLGQNLKADTAVRIDLLAQAAQAWILAGAPARAESILTATIALQPDSSPLYIDRAQATAAAGRYRDAVADLDRALDIDPDDADALTLRASARRHLGNVDSALLDAEEALQLVPDHFGALLERGILHRSMGNLASARRDWLRILEMDPEGPSAIVARARLQDMDIKAQ